MELSALPADETSRLYALRRYNILDTPPDGAFDRITQLAARLLKVPIAIVSLVDADRIWFKSHYGVEMQEVPRAPGLCASAIFFDKPWVVNDAKHDPRTLANPLVAGEFGLRFYAGSPLRTRDGYNLGTLCVMDRQPRQITAEETAILKDLAAIVIDEMELRLASRQAIEFQEKLRQRALEEKEQLHRFALERLRTEKALRDSEERYHSLVELASDWHWEQDANCRFTRISTAISAMEKRYYGSYIGKTFRDLPGSMSDSDWLAYELAVERQQPFHDLIYRCPEKGHRARYISVSGRPVFADNGSLRGYRGTAKDVTEKILAQQKLERSHAALRQLTSALQEFRESERKRIAHELHDELAQLLAASRLDLSLLQQEILDTVAFQQRFEALDQMLGSSIEALRRIATDLRPSALDEGGLYYALRSLIRNFCEKEGVSCNLIADENELAIDENTSTAVFRIVQECLNNIASQPEANKVQIDLRRTKDVLLLKIQADGRNISEVDLESEKSFGLLEVRERIREMGGTIVLAPVPGQGTRVEISLPLAPDQDGEQ